MDINEFLNENSDYINKADMLEIIHKLRRMLITTDKRMSQTTSLYFLEQLEHHIINGKYDVKYAEDNQL